VVFSDCILVHWEQGDLDAEPLDAVPELMEAGFWKKSSGGDVAGAGSRPDGAFTVADDCGPARVRRATDGLSEVAGLSGVPRVGGKAVRRAWIWDIISSMCLPRPPGAMLRWRFGLCA
jgi:hypothetical protein